MWIVWCYHMKIYLYIYIHIYTIHHMYVYAKNLIVILGDESSPLSGKIGRRCLAWTQMRPLKRFMSHRCLGPGCFLEGEVGLVVFDLERSGRFDLGTGNCCFCLVICFVPCNCWVAFLQIFCWRISTSAEKSKFIGFRKYVFIVF